MDHDDRTHLYRIFGPDLPALPAQLDIAARHHRELAAHLRHRTPDQLITAAGAAQLAAGHDADADRCERIAAAVRSALDGHRDGDPDADDDHTVDRA
jgi:hypothetical protein